MNRIERVPVDERRKSLVVTDSILSNNESTGTRRNIENGTMERVNSRLSASNVVNRQGFEETSETSDLTKIPSTVAPSDQIKRKQLPHDTANNVATSAGKFSDHQAVEAAAILPGGSYRRDMGLDLGEWRASAAVESITDLGHSIHAGSKRTSVSTVGGSNRGVEAKFVMQRLSLETANAPLISRPTAPFAKSERKRAFLAARYYSECFLNGITPIAADTAALDAQSHYDKWWIKAKYRQQDHEGKQEQGQNKNCEQHKRCKHDPADPSLSHMDKKRKLLLDHKSPVKKERICSEESKLFPAEARLAVRSEDTAELARLSSCCDYFATKGDQNSQDKSSVDTNQMRVVAGRLQPLATTTLTSASVLPKDEIDTVKSAMINYLKKSGGDTSSSEFLSYLDVMRSHYVSSQIDARWGMSGALDTGASATGHSSGSPFSRHGAVKESSWLDGTWLTLSKSTYEGCLGRNENNDPLYTLGRLAFDMYRPCDLVCSLQGVYNAVGLTDLKSDDSKRPRSFPLRLAKEQKRRSRCDGGGRSESAEFPAIRNYDIVAAFAVEPNQTRRGTAVTVAGESGEGEASVSNEVSPGADANASAAVSSEPDAGEYVVRKPIHGLLTNHGYCIPDPKVPNRLSVWFSGGSLEVQDDKDDLADWKDLFDENKVPRRDMKAFARVLAAQLLTGANFPEGMEEDGTMRFTLNRPIGGHGSVFIDVLYADETFRIARGHQGSIIVLTRSL